MLKIQSYSPAFLSRSRNKNAANSCGVYFKDGVAFCNNGDYYSGLFRHTTRDGDEFILVYKNGQLKKSIKNNQIYKIYPESSNEYKDIGRKFFSDGSYMPYQHLWHINDEDIKTIYDAENNTFHHIFRNAKKFFHITLDNEKQLETKHIIKFDNEKEVNFSSVRKAQSYFLKKYGIDAEFSDVSQAIQFKQAVDAFVPLNYKNKGKRLFEGLVVETDAFFFDSPDARAFLYCDVLGCEDMSDEELIQYIKENPSSIRCSSPVLIINPNYDLAPDKINLEYRTKKFSNRFYSGDYIHELAHWLHLQNDPDKYYLSGMISPTEDEKEIFKQVSRYASNSYAEFVAEYVTGRLEGNSYSREVDDYYKELGGPDLFKD